MRIVMKMDWSNIRKDQYESLRKSVNWEGNMPVGAVLHIASFSDKGIHVTDIWENENDLNNFLNKRLMPEVIKLGVTNKPVLEITPLHALFTPGI